MFTAHVCYCTLLHIYCTRTLRLSDVRCRAAGEDGVYVQRMVGKVEWGRPLGTGWHGNLGVTWQQVPCAGGGCGDVG